MTRQEAGIKVHGAGPRAILFDIFGVLLSSSFPSGGDRLAALLGRPAEEIEPIYVRWEHPWDRGQITVEQFWDHVQRELGTAVDWLLLDQAVLDSIHPLPGSLALLDACARQADVYLLSDTRREWFERLDRRHGLRRRVKRAFLSYDVGFGKAEPACFEHVLAELQLAPRQIVFLDDRAANVATARHFGIEAIQFVNADRAAADLRAFFPDLRLLS